MARNKPLKKWSRSELRKAQNQLLNQLKRQSWIPKGAGAKNHLLPEGTVVQRRWLVPIWTFIGKTGKPVKQKRYAIGAKVRWAFGKVKEDLDENGILWAREFVHPLTGEQVPPRLVTVIRWPKHVPKEMRQIGLYEGISTERAFVRYRFPTTQEWHPLEGPPPTGKEAQMLVDNPVFVATFDSQGNLLANLFQEPRELIRSGLWRLLSKGNQNVVHPGQEIHFTTRGETLRSALAKVPFVPAGWGAVGQLEAQFIAVDGVPVDMSDHPMVATPFAFTKVMAKGTQPLGPVSDSLLHVRRDLERQLQDRLQIESVRTSSDDTLDRLMGQVEAEIMGQDLSTSREYRKWCEYMGKSPSKAQEKLYKKELTKRTLKAYKERKENLRAASIEIGMVLKLSHLSVLEDPRYMSQNTVEQELAMWFKRRVDWDSRGIVSKKTAQALLARANEIVKKQRRSR